MLSPLSLKTAKLQLYMTYITYLYGNSSRCTIFMKEELPVEANMGVKGSLLCSLSKSTFFHTYLLVSAV